MARTNISSISLRAMLAQETDEAFCMLATLQHSSFAQPLRVCSNLEPVISKDPNTMLDRYFFGARFDIQWPSDTNGEMPRAQVVVDNVSTEIGAALQLLAAQPTSPNPGGNTLKVTIEFIRLSDPDTIEAIWDNLTVRTVKVDDTTVTGNLTYENILNEPLAASITQSTIPVVFG